MSELRCPFFPLEHHLLKMSVHATTVELSKNTDFSKDFKPKSNDVHVLAFGERHLLLSSQVHLISKMTLS